MPRGHILIVEDDADYREALCIAMAETGVEIAAAADGVEALALLRSGPLPSVILLDLRLPRMSGEEFLRELRSEARFERVPVITMTGGTGVVRGNDVVARLHKPIDIVDLNAIVQSLLIEAAAA
jgi:DNA-binding response OmpR family regulator